MRPPEAPGRPQGGLQGVPGPPRARVKNLKTYTFYRAPLSGRDEFLVLGFVLQLHSRGAVETAIVLVERGTHYKSRQLGFKGCSGGFLGRNLVTNGFLSGYLGPFRP